MSEATAAAPTPRWNEQGLLPAVVQHHATGDVLMLGWVNEKALRLTLAEGRAWFWSRSRQSLWRKGDTSGNVITVSAVWLDCDGDTLVYRGLPAGPACHTGAPTCFFTRLALDGGNIQSHPLASVEAAAPPPDVRIIDEVLAVIRDRQATLPEDSYTAYLFRSGVDKIGKKIGEESAEVIIAAKNGEAGPIALETADLLYHAMVMLAACGVEPSLVWQELAKRRR